MKLKNFIASSAVAFALLVTAATPSLASAQYSQYQYQYVYPPSYTASGYTYTAPTPYWCGMSWTAQPCTYSYSNSNTIYQVQPNYYYQNPNQYQTQSYGNAWYGNRNTVCPAGYYLWGKNCWVNPSQSYGSQLWYRAF